MRIIKSITGSFFFVFTIAGLCSGSSLAQGYSQRADADKIRKDCPDLDEKSVQELANVKPGPGAHGYTYAHMFCVPLAEAAHRTTLQIEKMGVIEQVTSEIIKNESTTYVNHWLRHNPDYKLVIEFTHNAAVLPWLQLFAFQSRFCAYGWKSCLQGLLLSLIHI